MHKLTVREALEYMQQLLEIESEKDNDEENISLEKILYLIFLYNVLSEKQCVNKRKKVSDSNPDEMNSGTFVRIDGMCWKSIISGSCIHGRIAEHNVFNEKSGPTSYAEQNFENSYTISSWRLLIDEPMLGHIKNCTEEDTQRQLGKNEWSTTLD
ncbi:hypothetical protein TNCV_2990351 [Trichonephila clavipes]|nr:hypothetical protein TNCV_2990351 [Trichonephila clavipes]